MCYTALNIIVLPDSRTGLSVQALAWSQLSFSTVVQETEPGLDHSHPEGLVSGHLSLKKCFTSYPKECYQVFVLTAVLKM